MSEWNHGEPGQRNGVVVNFFDLNEQQLAVMASDLSLTMGQNELRRCQVSFAKQKPSARFPTIYEIDFLDAVLRRHYESADAIRIGRTNAGHTHLSATREDLIQKLRTLCPHLSDPISLSDAAEVASRYLDAIGIGRERADNGVSDTPSATDVRLPRDAAILLLLPSAEDVSYEQAVKESLADPAIVGQLLHRGRISPEGIALTFAKETHGIHVNLAMLDSSDPLCLLTAHVGTHWVATQRDAIAPLREALAAHGIRAVFFAITTNSDMLTLERGDHPFLALELGLLREFVSPGRATDFHLAVTDDRTAPFFEALYDATVCAMLGCADGVHRTAQCPTVRYEFPCADLSPEACGRDLEAILGVYRAWIELCVADRATVDFSDSVTTPVWTITQPRRLPEQYSGEDSQTFVISLPVTEDGLPDFAACRTLCDTLTRLSAEGKFLSCRQAEQSVCKEISAVRALLVEAIEPLPFPLAPQVSAKER